MRYVPIRSEATRKELLRKKSLAHSAFGHKKLTDTKA